MAEAALTLAVILCLGWIAAHDFRTMLIRNRAIVALVVLYLLLLVVRGGIGWPGDLVAGLLLFTIGLIAWLLKVMGAGDVKLYFALGLLMGFGGLLSFAIIFVGVTFGFAFLLFAAARTTTDTRPWPRLREMHSKGKVPYAVPMILAALPVIAARGFGMA